MNLYGERVRRYLNKAPLLKAFLKSLFGGLLQQQDRRQRHKAKHWIQSTQPSKEVLRQQSDESGRLKYRPLISVVVPLYNTPRSYFFEMIESVRQQTYDNWELILVDDASSDKDIHGAMKQVTAFDSRITARFLSKNLHISGATNQAIKLASGEFISLFDHDDILRHDALFEIVSALNKNPKLDFIYTDEAKVNQEGSEYSDLFFKPDWNPDMLCSINYITHFTTIRRSVLEEKGGLDATYNGAQDWELFLRLTRSLKPESIYHIPKILYYWRIHDLSTAKSLDVKPYVIQAQRRAIEAHLNALGYQDFSLKQDETYRAQWHVSFAYAGNPKVSIVTSSDRGEKIGSYIAAHTSYSNYEFVKLQNSLSLKELREKVSGEFVVFLGSKVKIKHGNWIEDLLGDAGRPGIGFVASLQGKRGLERSLDSLLSEPAASFVKSSSIRALSRHFYATTRYNIDTVEETTAMIELKKLLELNNTNATTSVTELSQCMGALGYRNLYNPYIRMIG